MLAESPWRQVVLVDHDAGLRVVRRIRSQGSEGPDLVDRAGALGLVRQVRIPGFAYLEDRAIVGGTLEIAESYVDGVVVGSALELVREAITVGVAISIAHDIALGLSVIHSMIEPSGRPAGLVHGRIDVNQMIVSPSGDVRLIGLEGVRGLPGQDVQDLLQVLHSLLVAKASSKAGSALLERLAQLKFESARQMVSALTAYLDRQKEGEVKEKRAAFAAQICALAPDRGFIVKSDSSQAPRVFVPETPTDSGDVGTDAGSDVGGEVDEGTEVGDETSDEAHEELPEIGASLGSSTPVHVDEDGDGPTITDSSIPDSLVIGEDSGVMSTDTLETVDSTAAAAREALLAPASTQKPEAKPAADKSITVGNYRVVASIGRGGMGEIYLAKSMSEHYRGLVALKVLGVDDSADDEALGMFIDEAAIMARIDHPNVLKVVDFGRARHRHFLAMEYLEGRPLVRVMIDAYAKETGLDYGVIAAIGADAARGLFAAHTSTGEDGAPLRVVHRDVSPQNIFVTYSGLTKVIDFGVARASQRVSKTAVGVVKGKAAYMSPEQTEGKEVDARSDVFSLGVCLWEMTAGRRLFKRDTEYDTLMAVSTAAIERPTQVRGKPNPVLDRVIMNALSRNREKRTPSALELAAQLTEYAQGVGLRDTRGGVKELMQRLFGGVAAEERALISQFEARAATEQEADSFRQLSGVAYRKGHKSPEITLIGAPNGLMELERFGEKEAPKAASVVLRAVEAIKADKAKSPISGNAISPIVAVPAASNSVEPGPFDSTFEIVTVPPPMNDDPLEPMSSEAGTAIDIEDGDFEAIGSKSSSAVNAVPEDAPITLAAPPPRKPSSMWASEPSSDVIEPIDGLVPPETTAKAPAANIGEKKGRGVIWAAAAALVIAFVVIGFYARSQRGEGQPKVVDAVLDREAVAAKQPMKIPPVEVADEPVTKIRTSTASVEAMLDALEGRGVTVAASGSSLLVTDRFKGSAVVAKEARVRSVKGENFGGFLVETDKRGVPKVLWIGSIANEPAHVRALSVNDCAAEARVEDRGVVLSYGKEELVVPYGGASLKDVSLDRPEFADRVELEPLGLAFGKKDEARPARACSVGWWGKQVVLRGLPEGAYSLRWSGPGQETSVQLVVTEDEVTGGRFVGTSSTSR